MSSEKYYQVTEKELFALIAVADTVNAMKGYSDNTIKSEADAAQKAISSIGDRHGVEFERECLVLFNKHV